MSDGLRVAVLGPKGQCGSCVVDELLSRGHSVVGISRTPPQTWGKHGEYLPQTWGKHGEYTPQTWGKHGEYEGIPCDFNDIRGLSRILSDGKFDTVISAFGPPLVDLKTVYSAGVEGHGNIKMALLRSTFRGHLIIIGGAGSLHYKNGVQLCDDGDFCFKHWYAWPNVHLDYMSTRMYDHGQGAFGTFIRLFKWAKWNREAAGWVSWLFRPLANSFLRLAKKKLTSSDTIGLILCSRAALTMWEGVQEINWSFLSPPWQLRDKGVRTGKYEVHVDDSAGSAEHGIHNGIYNEDMAVAIVDEVENKRLTHKHWTCTGPVGLNRW